MTLVSCFIVGSAKSMTSSFCEVLNMFEGVHKPKVKEPGYFANLRRNNVYVPSAVSKKGIAWYHNLYLDSKSSDILYDASQIYSQYPFFCSAPLIHDYNKNAKIIYLISDPIRRMYSHYRYDLFLSIYRRGLVVKPQSLGKIFSKTSKYYYASDYRLQIERYQKLFRSENILILDTNDLQATPGSVVQVVGRFLGLSDLPLINNWPRINTASSVVVNHCDRTVHLSSAEVRLMKVRALQKHIAKKIHLQLLQTVCPKHIAKQFEIQELDERRYRKLANRHSELIDGYNELRYGDSGRPV